MTRYQWLQIGLGLIALLILLMAHWIYLEWYDAPPKRLGSERPEWKAP